MYTTTTHPIAAVEAVVATKRMLFVFDNHPPLRVTVAADCKNLYDATADIVCDTNQEWGHQWLGYLETKSGKRIYVASENCGMTYNGREPRTSRTVVKDPLAWLAERGARYYNRHCHEIDPSLILDLDTL